ncbi:MAG TPA: mechanosensitive ion channel family protein, partial [Treponemataceae bacterium]|nr:mechanosensitive ion channel family protein [Treponemataceae bacterium]
GVDLSAVLGAAGILGVAAGFAAQTSVSNIISGFFVMTERAFRIGDLLKVDSVSGVVESISLLSIRLRTPDNQLIRIPNETIIKTNLVNMSHFDNRRFDLRVSVSYGTDLRAVRELLLDIAKNNEFALQEPAPILIFDTLAPSAIEIMLGVWGKKENFLALKNSMMIDVTERFRTENVTVPYPRLDVAMKTSE